MGGPISLMNHPKKYQLSYLPVEAVRAEVLVSDFKNTFSRNFQFHRRDPIVESTLLKEHIEANSLTRQKIRDNRIRLNEYTSGGDLLDQLRLVFHWPFISAF